MFWLCMSYKNTESKKIYWSIGLKWVYIIFDRNCEAEGVEKIVEKETQSYDKDVRDWLFIYLLFCNGKFIR